MPDSNEQWLLDGICRECRRKDYCSEPCKRNRARIIRETVSYIYDRTGMVQVLDAIGMNTLNNAERVPYLYGKPVYFDDLEHTDVKTQDKQ